MSLPVTLQLAQRCALIVGGGPVATRKAGVLHAAGAELRVVAPRIDEALAQLLDRMGGEKRQRVFAPRDLDGIFLAVAATDDPDTNARILAEARHRGILTLDASDGDRGDVSMPAVLRAGELTIAVDTGGASPAFALRVLDELRERYGERHAAALKNLRYMRAYVKQALPAAERGRVLAHLAQLPVERLATMRVRTLTAATRGSALARTQTQWVAARLAEHGIVTEMLAVTTTGDRLSDRPLAAISSRSIFVKELETALLQRHADFAVHSCKDLPSSLPSQMTIAAVCRRADPRDVFCSERFRSFESLPAGARVGTSSPRRRAQLAAMRGDLDYVDVRGNVDTRLRKLRDGDYDAAILAAAGLDRLGIAATHTVAFDPDDLVPATGQGALAIETLSEDAQLIALLRDALSDQSAQFEIACERAALRQLGGACQTPIGIHARFQDGTLRATGVVASAGGTRLVRHAVVSPVAQEADAEALGMLLAKGLIESGADAVLRPEEEESLP